jgi:hypothetical protein
MTTIEIEISCCFCPHDYRAEVEIPDGWQVRYGSLGSENGFCPDHSAVLPFANSQCPGCVASWGDCPMWRAFAYDHGRDITEADLETIKSGYCPRRANGTFSLRANQDGTREWSKADLSVPAPAEAGVAFASAIREYSERYNVR